MNDHVLSKLRICRIFKHNFFIVMIIQNNISKQATNYDWFYTKLI